MCCWSRFVFGIQIRIHTNKNRVKDWTDWQKFTISFQNVLYRCHLQNVFHHILIIPTGICHAANVFNSRRWFFGAGLFLAKAGAVLNTFEWVAWAGGQVGKWTWVDRPTVQCTVHPYSLSSPSTYRYSMFPNCFENGRSLIQLQTRGGYDSASGFMQMIATETWYR